MKRSAIVKLYVSTFAVFLAIDFVWLSFIAQGFYEDQIGFLLSDTPNAAAAGIFYLLFVAGLLYFVVLPALKQKKVLLRYLALAGGFFGLVTYATYELTNFSTITDWPLSIVIVDLLWGIFLSGITSVISYLIGRRSLR